MKLARKCREHAIALEEMAEVAPEIEAQLRFIAHKWHTVAALREKIYDWKLSSQPPASPASIRRR
jgi:hypothetical protein